MISMNPQGVLKRNSESHKQHHIKWDEKSLEEQAKDRGQCPKIPEPKTPYNEAMESDEEKQPAVVEADEEIKEHLREAHINAARNQTHKADLKTLNEQLMRELQKEQLRELGGGETDQTEDQQKRRKHEEFIKRRTEHYSEFKRIQQAKKKHELDD